MSDDNLLGIIHYIDADNYYMIYGIATLIIVLLLLWFFIRTNLEYDNKRCSKCYKKINGSSCNNCSHKIQGSKCNLCSMPKQFCNCAEEVSASRKPIRTSEQSNLLTDIETKIKTEGCAYKSQNLTNDKLNDILPEQTREGMFPMEDPSILSQFPEFQEPDVQPINMTGGNKPYKLQKGIYGGVSVYTYDVSDAMYGPEWDLNTGIYIPNMRTAFKNVITPREKMYWDDDEINIDDSTTNPYFLKDATV